MFLIGILFTILLYVKGQEVVLTPPTIVDENTDTVPSDWDTAPILPNLNDGDGWTAPAYYSTIRALTLYQANWIFARRSDGMQGYKYDPTTKTWSTLSTLSDLADSNGWGDVEYYSTIQMIDLDHDIWLLARNADGLQMYQYQLFPNTWTPRVALDSLSDQNRWNREEYYSSIQTLGRSGQIWVFARGPSGEEVHKYDPSTGAWSVSSTLAAFSDTNQWASDPKYYSTIQVVKVGTNFWLLGRNSEGVQLYQFNPDTNSWTQKADLPDLSDQKGWEDIKYYSTIQAVALDTSIWLFARNESGVQTYHYDTENDVWTLKQSLPDLSDGNGWNTVEYYSTIKAVALNTSIALVARGPNGLQYYEYIPETDTWNLKSTITSLSDANNWNRPEYYSTIQPINNMGVINVIARGPFGLEIYSYINS